MALAVFALACQAATAASGSGTTSTSVAQTKPTASSPQSAAQQLLDTSGAADCTVTALTSSSDVGAFVGLGGDQTSSVTTSVDTDPTNPFEVDLTQGSDEGVKLGLSLKDPPLGGALVDELFGHTAAETFDFPDESDARQVIQVGEDLNGANGAFGSPLRGEVFAALASHAEQTYAAGDSSVGGSFSAFNALGGSAGLGLEVGEAHDKNGYSQLITTVSAQGDIEVALDASLSHSVDVVLTQDVIVDPAGEPIGVTDRLDFDSDGQSGLDLHGSKELPLKEGGSESGSGGEASGGGPPMGETPTEPTAGGAEGSQGADEKGGPLSDAEVDFGLQLGSQGLGETGDTVGTLALAGMPWGSRVLADLNGEANGNPLTSALDIVKLIGEHGLVTYRRDVFTTDESGFDVDVALGIDISLSFSSSDEQTTLLEADQILPGGRVVPYDPCQEAATIHLPTIAGPLPGLGATEQQWATVHHADLANSTDTTQPEPPCPPSGPAGCFGGFPEAYDSSGGGDLYKYVDPAETDICPIPFVYSALDAEEQSCRIGAMLIELPHPVDEAAADVLAHSQLPKDTTVSQPPPPVSQETSNTQCQQWSSPTLGSLEGFGDSGGPVEVAYISGSAQLQGLFQGLLSGGGSSSATFDPDDIAGIALFVPNQGRLTLLC